MFGQEFELFSFSQASQDVLPASQERDDCSRSQARTGQRTLSDGIMPCTAAILLSAATEGKVLVEHTELLGAKIEMVSLCGLARDIEETDDNVWNGLIDDGSGLVNFRYEVRTDLTAQYRGDLNRLKPDKNQGQWPGVFTGKPQMLDGTLLFMVSHCRPASSLEYVCSHPLEVAASRVLMFENDCNGESSSSSPCKENYGKDHLNKTSCSATAEKKTQTQTETETETQTETQASAEESAKDLQEKEPYFGQVIKFENEEFEDFCKSDRMRRVVVRYLNENASTKPVQVAQLLAFCAPKWNRVKIQEVLGLLEEEGFTFWPSNTKETVQLTV